MYECVVAQRDEHDHNYANYKSCNKSHWCRKGFLSFDGSEGGAKRKKIYATCPLVER